MALGKNLATGRFDATQTSVMKKISKPKFVDNGVRHAEYTKQQSGFLVKAPTSSDFMPTHDRKYSLIEEEDTIRLTHNVSDGHRYTGNIFLNDDKVTTSTGLPPLIIGAENPEQALVPASIESSEKGTRFRLGNLKGQELKQIGFTDKTVRIGQKANVGLRTTDLVSRIAKASTNSLNGIKINNPSGTFVAQDFYGVDGVSAIRFLARHDGYNANTDQFGNIEYSHQQKHGREHIITQTMVSEGSIETEGESTLNRVVVRGKSRANNDQNVVQVDDFGPQGDTVNEIPGGIFAPTAITKASSKAIGRRLLSMAKKAKGNEKLVGTLMSSRVQPGDVISYETITDSKRKIVLSVKHNLTERKSDIDINSVEGSIEDILQRFQEVDISSSIRDNEERNRQFSQEEFATAFGYNIKISYRVETRTVKDPTGGMSIGIPATNIIHGRRHLKSTGILINNGGGHAVGTTNFTTDGTNANSVFTSSVISDGKADAFVYRANGNLLGKVSSAGTTSVVIATASPDLVEDDEELFQISTDTLPESANSHLKIKMNKGTFSNRRRG
tara:strand:+ start:292 stop:1962 length:1671 start_codon:yes stop_codon:yes gene_type:complete